MHGHVYNLYTYTGHAYIHAHVHVYMHAALYIAIPGYINVYVHVAANQLNIATCDSYDVMVI